MSHSKTGNIDVESMIFRKMRSSLIRMILQMPLSNMNGLVIVLLKSFGNGNLIECNKTIRLGGRQFIAGTLGAGCSANVTNIDSARVFTRENACPGGEHTGLAA